MPPPSNEYVLELRMECGSLARDMVRLEQWARDAYERRNWVRVGELHTQREGVQAYRSRLLRQMWIASGRRRIREALREA